VSVLSAEVGLKVATYFSPDDDTQKVFLDFIRSTKQKLRIAIYGLHLPPLIDELINLHRNGVDVAIVIDHSQARGKYTRPEVEQLRAVGIQLLEGTSDEHKIMHHKFAVRDGASVLSGSWNFSLTASEESNYFDVVDSDVRAQLFLSKWQEIWDWVAAHEQQYQEVNSDS
jgi:phosphatidylserine/phosphatidylglycerophosphate/cardiolipin synthase-like enzyme